MQKRGAVVIFMFGIVLVLSGCVGSGTTSVNVDDDTVNVKTPDTSVQIGSDGVDVKTGGVTVQTGKDSMNSVSENMEQKNMEVSKNTVLIIDASGSMNTLLGGEKKIDIAKRSAGLYIDKLPSGTNLSVVAYGHIGSNSASDKAKSCAGIEEIYYLGQINTATVKNKINALPSLGWTPITKSLEKGRDILSSKTGAEKEILLISDGKETCGGNPITTAKSLCSMGIRVDVIGFNVSGADEEQLKSIAGQCGGYASVNSADEFKTIIDSGNIHVVTPGASVKIRGGKLEVLTNEAQVQIGSDGLKVNTDAANVKASTKDLKVKTDAANVKVNIPGL